MALKAPGDSTLVKLKETQFDTALKTVGSLEFQLAQAVINEERDPARYEVVDKAEVNPEPGYCLFVRFADGLSGRVQLRLEDFTGALAPLRDVRFFEQVFIDQGAVAWPGEDLAPDAMYEELPAGEL